MTAPSGPWSMCGVESVAISFGGGRTSVVETGMTAVGDKSIVDAAPGSEVGVSALVGGASVAETAGEQADRIRVRKRSAWIGFITA